MSTSTDSASLFKKYIDEYGTTPTRPEYFITFCKKHGVKLRYKDCREIIQNPPQINPKLIKTPSNSLSGHSLNSNDSNNESDPYENNEQDELKYTHISHEHNNTNSHHDSHTQSSKSITLSIKQNNFTQLSTRERNISNPMSFSMDISNNSNYISPEILLNQIIPINNNNNSSINIISFHKNSNIYKNRHKYKYLFRDFIFTILYWFLLINGFFDFYDFGFWYFRFICFFLWNCILFISILCHYRFNSPPYYPVYYKSDSKYKPYFNKSAMQYIKHLCMYTYIDFYFSQKLMFLSLIHKKCSNIFRNIFQFVYSKIQSNFCVFFV